MLQKISYSLNMVKVCCHGKRMQMYSNGIQIYVISGTAMLIFMYPIVHQVTFRRHNFTQYTIYNSGEYGSSKYLFLLRSFLIVPLSLSRTVLITENNYMFYLMIPNDFLEESSFLGSRSKSVPLTFILVPVFFSNSRSVSKTYFIPNLCQD